MSAGQPPLFPPSGRQQSGQQWAIEKGRVPPAVEPGGTGWNLSGAWTSLPIESIDSADPGARAGPGRAGPGKPPAPGA